MTKTDGNKRDFSVLLLGLVLLSSLALKLYFAPLYSTFRDELLSAFVADSISRTGLPLLQPGTIYPRAPLHHYLLSIPIGFFGINYLTMRIVSIVLSLATLLTVYALGSRIASRAVGLWAALILSVLSLFNQFVLSGRMYMTYGALHILSFYLFYEGFVRGRTVARWLAIAAMAATMLSSELGLLVGPIYFLLLGVYYRRDWLKEKSIYVGAVVWLALFWFVRVYDLPGALVAFSENAGVPHRMLIGAEMPLKEIVANLSWPWSSLDRTLPFSLPFVLTIALVVAWKRDLRRHYAFNVMLPIVVISSLYAAYRVQHRIIVAWLPLYCLAFTHFVSVFVGWLRDLRSKSPGARLVTLYGKATKRAAIPLLVFLVFLVGICLRNNVTGPSSVLGYVHDAFGYQDYRTDRDPEPAYSYLQSVVGPDDEIVVTTLEYGFFFLGREHSYHYLRQRMNLDGTAPAFGPFDKEAEPYFGIRLLDSVDELERLMETSSSTIWVAASERSESYVGSEMMGIIETEFDLVFDDPQEFGVRVYRRRPAT